MANFEADYIFTTHSEATMRFSAAAQCSGFHRSRFRTAVGRSHIPARSLGAREQAEAPRNDRRRP
jgi:hypothetical protein